MMGRVVVALFFHAAAAHSNFSVAAYLPEWRYEGANFVDMAAVVTHLILFSLEVQPTGRLAALDRLPRKELMEDARAATRASGSKLLICIGGNGRSAGFTHAVAKKDRRARFVASLSNLLDEHDLDGVDLNWEYPGYDFKTGYASDDILQRDYRGMAKLLKALHEAFAPTGRTVTLAYYPDGKQEALITEHGFAQVCVCSLCFTRPDVHARMLTVRSRLPCRVRAVRRGDAHDEL